MHDTHSGTPSFLRIAIFFVLIVIALWSSYQLITTAPRLFGGKTIVLSNILHNNTPTVAFALANTTLHSGTEHTITWDAQNISDAGVFLFAYACNEGFTLAIAHTDETGDTQFRTLPCNTPYSLSPETRSLTVIPYSPAKRFVDSALSIAFVFKDGERVQDTVHIVGLNDALSDLASVAARAENTSIRTDTLRYRAPNNAPAPEPIPVATTRMLQLPSQPRTDASGMPDLSVSITNASGGENASVNGYAIFRVYNNGSNASGSWTFSTALTTLGDAIFLSKPQESIPSGGYTDVGVAFEAIQVGSTFVVTIDPNDAVAESNENNNTASTLIYGYEF